MAEASSRNMERGCTHLRLKRVGVDPAASKKRLHCHCILCFHQLPQLLLLARPLSLLFGLLLGRKRLHGAFYHRHHLCVP